MKSKITTYALIAVLLLIAAYWGYRFFGREPEPVRVTVTAGAGGSGASTLSGDQINSASQLSDILESVSQITLAERSLLDNRIFQTELQDFGRPLAERPWGRNNPFAAPGVGGGPAPAQAATTDIEPTSPETDDSLAPTSP